MARFYVCICVVLLCIAIGDAALVPVGSGVIQFGKAEQLSYAFHVDDVFAYGQEAAAFKSGHLDTTQFGETVLLKLGASVGLGSAITFNASPGQDWRMYLAEKLRGHIDNDDRLAFTSQFDLALPLTLRCEQESSSAALLAGDITRIIVQDAPTRSKQLCSAVVAALKDHPQFTFRFDSTALAALIPTISAPQHCLDQLQSYTLTCRERQCNLHHDDNTALPFGSFGQQTMFALGKLAVQAIALDMCCGDVKSGADVACLADRFAAEKVKLVYKGNEAEGKVLQFYLQVELALPANQASITVHADTLDTSAYESFGFHNVQKLLSKLVSGWAQTQTVLEQLVTYNNTALSIPERRSRQDVTVRRPLRLGIAGATSSGKSTLVNALLRRDISPMTLQVCTGTIVEFVHLPDVDTNAPAQITVHFAPLSQLREVQQNEKKFLADLQKDLADASSPSAMQRIIQTVKDTVEAFSGTSTASLADQVAATKSKLDALEPIAAELRETSRTLSIPEASIAAMTKYTSVADGNRLPEFVERVVVAVPHPLLADLTLVDTPGTQDMADSRAGAARRAINSLDAWIYLVDASQTIKPSTVRDLEILHESGKPGMLTFSKSNMMLDQIDVDQYQENLVRLRKEFSAYTNGSSPIPAVNSKGYWEVIRYGGVLPKDRKEREKVRMNVLQNSYGLKYLRFVAPQLYDDVDLYSAIRDLMKSADTDAGAQRLLEHVFLEASGMVQLLSEVHSFLFQRDVLPRYHKGVAALLNVVDIRLNGIDEIARAFTSELERNQLFELTDQQQITNAKTAVQLKQQALKEDIEALSAARRNCTGATSAVVTSLQRSLLALRDQTHYRDRAMRELVTEARRIRDSWGFWWGQINVDLFRFYDLALMNDAMRVIYEGAKEAVQRSNLASNELAVDLRQALWEPLDRCGVKGHCLSTYQTHWVSHYKGFFSSFDSAAATLRMLASRSIPVRAQHVFENAYRLVDQLNSVVQRVFDQKEAELLLAEERLKLLLTLIDNQRMLVALRKEHRQLEGLRDALKLKFQPQKLQAQVQGLPKRAQDKSADKKPRQTKTSEAANKQVTKKQAKNVRDEL